MVFAHIKDPLPRKRTLPFSHKQIPSLLLLTLGETLVRYPLQLCLLLSLVFITASATGEHVAAPFLSSARARMGVCV